MPGRNRHDLRDPLATTPFGEDRFYSRSEEGRPVIYQRSMLYPDVEWPVPQLRDISDGSSSAFNPRANAAHNETSSRGGRAHGDGRMECYTCHSSWITACFGCHLPQQANWKTPVNHFEAKDLRNYATYNPQVARDSEFMLGVAGDVKGNRIAPVRSSSAIVISSQDAQRQKIYGQVPTISANGMSSQVFNTHFPHTVRTKETRACGDCHVSGEEDNNAWLAQVMLLGTNYVNFMGYNAYVGMGSGGFAAVRVTEWDEPQAVIGSHLHEMAYPDRYREHLENGRVLQKAETHGGRDIRSLQLRGEYLYTANGKGGLKVYDVANVNNKGFSLKMVTSPVSPLGQHTHVDTEYATAVALPFNNHISMSREFREDNKETPYYYDGKVQNMHELYRYAYVSDRYEGLVIVDIDCLTDFDPQNNFTRRAATFNPDGILDGAEDLTVAGTTVYVACDRGIVAVDIDDPLEPRVIDQVGAPHVVEPTSVQVQFRFAFVTDSEGLKVLEVTKPADIEPVPGASVAIPGARDVYVARTYAYVSAGSEGLVIVDVKNPTEPQLHLQYTSDGRINDLYQTRVAMTNDTLFAYLADGVNGLAVLKLVAPNDGGRSAYGFSPSPVPELIATWPTRAPAIALSEGLDRDRAVDESGNQVTVFGRIGGRPMNLEEMQRLYIQDGQVYRATMPDEPQAEAGQPAEAPLTAGQ